MQMPKLTRQTKGALLAALVLAVVIPAAWVCWVRIRLGSRLNDLKSDDPERVSSAAAELSLYRSGPSVRVIVAALDDESQDKKRLTDIISRIGQPAVGPLIGRLRSKSHSLMETVRPDTSFLGRLKAGIDARQVEAAKQPAVDALIAIGEPAAALLVQTLKSDDPVTRQLAAQALAGMREPPTGALFDALSSKDPTVRATVVGPLAWGRDPRGLDAAIARLRDANENSNVRMNAAYAVANSRSPQASDALVATLDDGNGRLVEWVISILMEEATGAGSIGGRRIPYDETLGAITAHKNPLVVKGLIGALQYESLMQREDAFVMAVEALTAIDDPRTPGALSAAARGTSFMTADDYSAAALEICGKGQNRAAVDAAVGAANIERVAADYRTVVKNGYDSKTRAALIVALERSGNMAMAQYLANSGDAWLAGIARFWAKRKGVSLESTDAVNASPVPSVESSAPLPTAATRR
jgi:HEAT repeat protein